MAEATTSRVRLHDLSALGRYPSASSRRVGTDASSIATAAPRRPNTFSSRPAADDLMASAISCAS